MSLELSERMQESTAVYPGKQADVRLDALASSM